MAPGQALTLTPMPHLSPAPMGAPHVQPVQFQPASCNFVSRYVKILISLVLFLVGTVIPFYVVPEVSPDLTLSQHLTIGYVLWALFWGLPASWRLWRKYIFNTNFLFVGCSPVGMAWGLTAFCLLVLGSYFYCLFGGGIYQFFRHWWLVSRTA
jgi:hypothetical protein